MQATGESVAAVAELAAGVQAREDQLHAADLLLRMHVHGHAAPIIGHLERLILVQRDADGLAMPRDGLIDRVVDDLVGQVIRPRGVGVHAGPAPHRIQATEHFNVGGGVAVGHAAAGHQSRTRCAGGRYMRSPAPTPKAS